jgi:hypothetical protein
MNVEIGTEATQWLFWEYVYGIFVAVRRDTVYEHSYSYNPGQLRVATTTQDSCDYCTNYNPGQLRLQPRTVATTTQDKLRLRQDSCDYNPGQLRLQPRTVVTTTKDSLDYNLGQLRLQPRTVATTPGQLRLILTFRSF